MFFGKSSSKPQSRIDCLIGTDTDIAGNVTFSGGLRVDGHVCGDIVQEGGKPSTVVLSEKARGIFKEAYPEDAVDRLWPRPVEPSWFAELRTQYAEKFKAA